MDELWQAYIELERIEPDMEKTWENLVIWELGMVKQRCFHLPQKMILDDVQLKWGKMSWKLPIISWSQGTPAFDSLPNLFKIVQVWNHYFIEQRHINGDK